MTLLLLSLTLSSISLHPHWLVRLGDFPRLQIVKLILPTILANIYFVEPVSFIDRFFVFGLFACLIYQVARLLPHTLAYPREARAAKKDRDIRVMSFNVLMKNRDSEGVIECIRGAGADVVLIAEADEWWAEKLRVLGTEYPFIVSNPLGNCFGMMLFSRFELVETEIHFLVQPDIPSIHTKIRLPDGREIAFHGLHPRPPSPTDEGRSTERDAELMLVAGAIGEFGGPSIVAGDLNDVPWSSTIRVFKKLSGLVDPRVGRGLFNTFHSRNLLCRFPLDHVLYSGHFGLVRIDRIKKCGGSDHFPIVADLSLELEDAIAATPAESDRKLAEYLIRRALAPQETLGTAVKVMEIRSRIARSQCLNQA